jgi:predicted phage terminase large subunit-like protein
MAKTASNAVPHVVMPSGRPKKGAPSAQDVAVQQELASRILSRRRLLPFIQRMNPKYLAGWVHEDICRRLERFSDDVEKGLSPRLMLLMPPRAGKSEIASKMFPAWHLGRHPDHEMIACSYNVGLSMGFSKKIKAILDDPTYQTVFDTRLDPENRSTEEWGVHNNTGAYVAAGVGGGITGKGAHVLVIDDPIKNAEEADSAQIREGIWDWYGSTAYTRLAPGAGVLIIQTWWHDDDLAGRLQQAMVAGAGDEDVDHFEIIKYPAIAEADEYLDPATDNIVRLDPSQTPDEGLVKLRAKGDCLHEARYDVKKLLRIKKTIAARFWSALYQQNPVPDDGAFFTKDQFKRAALPRRDQCNVQIAWDFAISEKTHNDYTVGTVGLTDYDDILHVAEVVRFKSGDAHFIVDSIMNLAQRWQHASLQLGFEDGQIYRAIASLLAKEMKKRRFYPSVTVLKPMTDKKARASPLQGRMQQGMVSFASSLPDDMYNAVRNEMLRFPAGVHDDCVDSLAWMAQMAIDRQPPQRPREKKEKSWRDKLRGGTGSVSHMAA